jgi:hypothetical protein
MEDLENRATQGTITPNQERLYFRENPSEPNLKPRKDSGKESDQEPSYAHISKVSASRVRLEITRQVSR